MDPLEAHIVCLGSTCLSHIRHPLCCVFIVTNQSTHRNPVPTIKHTPLHTWTPIKSKCPSAFVFSSAPAMGAPMRVAKLCVSRFEEGGRLGLTYRCLTRSTTSQDVCRVEKDPE